MAENLKILVDLLSSGETVHIIHQPRVEKATLQSDEQLCEEDSDQLSDTATRDGVFDNPAVSVFSEIPIFKR